MSQRPRCCEEFYLQPSPESEGSSFGEYVGGDGVWRTGLLRPWYSVITSGLLVYVLRYA
jgi:hypothetical protein